MHTLILPLLLAQEAAPADAPWWVQVLVPLVAVLLPLVITWARVQTKKLTVQVQNVELRAATQAADAAVWRAVDRMMPTAEALKGAMADGKLTPEERAALTAHARRAGLQAAGGAATDLAAYIEAAIERAVEEHHHAAAATALAKEGRRSEATAAIDAAGAL